MAAWRPASLLWFAALAAWLSPAPASAEQPETRVMTFNIRYGTANDGMNRWDNRKEFLVATIKAFDPDLLGTQETLGFQRDYLAAPPDYAVLGVGRDDGKEEGEMMASITGRSDSRSWTKATSGSARRSRNRQQELGQLARA
jgi:endonuclease/exonuclease/phosphatase family metal-dependent hydrolase